jgi:TatD DNase family protein
MWTDTHAHLDHAAFEADLDDVLQRAREAGVRRFVTIGTTVEGSRSAVALAERHADVFAAVGVHPEHAAETTDDFPEALEALARHPRVVAIGEAGLDYFRLPGGPDASSDDVMTALGASDTRLTEGALERDRIIAAQKTVFAAQLELAAALGKNLVVHQRSSWADTLEMVRPFTGRVRCVFHCFGGTPGEALEVIGLGHLVSFTGILTFRKSTALRDTAAALPPGSYMVETDCPYLAPEPHRGKRCEPAHAVRTAETLAECRGLSPAQLSLETEATAAAFFGLA